MIISLFSCKKDSDATGPKITINTPVENQTFNVNDYVTVSATVTDDVKITSVSVRLLDATDHLVHATVPVAVTSPSMTINIQYLLDNVHLLTGVYYLEVFASDGYNDSRKFQKIYLVEVPKVVKSVFVVSNTGGASTNLSTIDSSFSIITPFHSFSGDYLSSSVSSYYQQATICGIYTGNFTGHILEFNIPEFTVAPVVSANPYFTGYYSNELYNYVSRYNGAIKGYDHNGNAFYNTNSLAGYYGLNMCFNDGYLLVEEKEVVSATKKLVTYFPSGGIEKNCSLAQDVVQFCEKDDANVFVFGNVTGQASIQLFDRLNNNLWNPYPFSLATGSLLCALKMDADTYLLGHSNGTIYKYQYSVGSVTTFLSGYTAVKMKYDDLSNQLYVAEANRICTFNYNTAALVNSVVSSENVLDIHLLYNR